MTTVLGSHGLCKVALRCKRRSRRPKPWTQKPGGWQGKSGCLAVFMVTDFVAFSPSMSSCIVQCCDRTAPEKGGVSRQQRQHNRPVGRPRPVGGWFIGLIGAGDLAELSVWVSQPNAASGLPRLLDRWQFRVDPIAGMRIAMEVWYPMCF